jgi:starch-binding outer membrane protein, SusD/RagB family
MPAATNTGTTLLRHRGGAMRIRRLARALGVLAVGACDLPNDPNLNGPSITDYATITALAQVQNLATGVLRGDRVHAENEIIEGEIIGRDAFVLTASETRWETELLGPSIDPSGFLGIRVFPYEVIRLANIGLQGVSAAPASVLTAQAKAATLGYLQTIKALLYLRVVETRDTMGAPIDVAIEATLPPAPLRCRHDVLNAIAALLDSAADSLAAGGVSFPFAMPAGFAGFTTPAGFLEFNRGLAAKTDVYRAFRNYPAAPDLVALDSADTALARSFMAQDVNQLDLGPAHNYSTASGDVANSLFDADTSSTTYLANPRVRSEADPGDGRVARKTALSSSRSAGGETSNIVLLLYRSPTAPLKILTNKELLLLKAEVEWGQSNLTGPGSAMDFANFIRTSDGALAADNTSTTSDAVLNRILYEKRYSLLWESAARWIDARLFGKLNGSDPPAGIGLERTYPPLNNLPIPQNEQNARGGNLTKQCTSGP